MSGMRLASPWWLLALVLVGLAAWWLGRQGPGAALLFSSTGVLGPAARAVRRRPGRWLAAFRLATLALVVLALARPQRERAETREDARGINLMLVLDYSGTMRTRDVVLDGRRVARSAALVALTGEFIGARTNDRVGLVTFDRDAFLASPLTLDHGWLMERLARETNGTGTDVGSALAVAAQHLQRHTNETRVIVLMTDAENISAGPEPAAVAEVIRPLGIRIHCVQILGPNQRWARDDVSETLTHAAARTGGAFFPVRTGADLRAVYGAIDRLEKQKLSETKQKGWRELFPWLVLPALGLLLAEQALAHTIWRRLP
jgi:Ca-activated chloride channel family protein